ncbi:MAG: penicillin acylase family protein [Actinomycetota bacterium]|nr:penicillin acylase family protein [Actinomycetota bacterium]
MTGARFWFRLLPAVLTASLVGFASVPVGAQSKPSKIRIIRDKHGVPHVFADDEEDASYGVGYALAQDRLWQMHVFRHIAKGRLSDILGPIVVDIDKTVRFFTYTEEERAARFKTYPSQIKKSLEAFVDGINAWIDEIRSDPSLMPFEFQEYGETHKLDDWTVDDSLALQDVLILAFGSGGGNELEHAGLLDALVEKFGKKKGAAAFDDLVLKTDPDTPLTIPRDYKFAKRSTGARTKDAQKRRSLEDDARLGLEEDGGGTVAPGDAAVGTLEQMSLVPDVGAALKDLKSLQKGLDALQYIFAFGSNAQIVGPKLSKFKNSLQTGGPQVGYLLPQWLADFGIHGGSFDATGMTFAGAGPAVLIGRGDGYAWTTTTGASDLTDTYVEKLNPEDPNQYRFKGSFEEMQCRSETYTFKGVPFDQEDVCRTRHGPVVSVDEENNVGYSLRYAWFNREGQTVEGFFEFQSSRSLQDYATFANYLASNHNMFYSDDEGNLAYWHPGNHVVRPRGIDIRLPQDGTGGSEWRGLLPVKKVPHTVNLDRDWLVNWNNQPSSGWQRERAHPALDNAIDLATALNPSGRPLDDPLGKGKIGGSKRLGFEDLSANLRYAAFKHHRHTYFKEFLPRKAKGKLETAALKTVKSWNGFLTDIGEGEYHAGKTILDRWVTKMRAAVFDDDLGEDLVSWSSESLLWHAINRDDRLRLKFDWLGKSSAKEVISKAFSDAVAELAEEFESEDPQTWREEVQMQHYQRLNADLFTDLLQGELGGNSGDSGWPGDVADHIRMDRGTYNHVVVYGPPVRRGPLGQSKVEAGSVIPPGQGGFITPWGEEGPHYEDQLDLYTKWKYKPMPMTLDEAKKVKESEEVIEREDDEGG